MTRLVIFLAAMLALSGCATPLLFIALAFALSGCASSSNTPAYWAAVSHSVGEHVGQAAVVKLK